MAAPPARVANTRPTGESPSVANALLSSISPFRIILIGARNGSPNEAIMFAMEFRNLAIVSISVCDSRFTDSFRKSVLDPASAESSNALLTSPMFCDKRMSNCTSRVFVNPMAWSICQRSTASEALLMDVSILLKNSSGDVRQRDSASSAVIPSC